MGDMKTLGQVGFEKYGNTAGIAGPWKTFDGRHMPKWEELQGDAGALTKVRWEEAVLEVLAQARPFLMRGDAPPGYAWDDFAKRYVQTGVKSGQAINKSPVGA